MRPWLTLAGLCAVLSGFVAIRADPAGAAPLSDCTAHRGTIVAVQFAHWGGPIVRGCGIKQPSGYALLHAAGFTTAGDEYDGPAFICRIGNQAFHDGTVYPTPSEDPCIQTPSASAYWSYWRAPAGQNGWTYSPLGPLGDVPAPGEVELWTFGATNVAGTRGSGVPTLSPSALRAANAVATTRNASPTRNASTTHTTSTTSTSRPTASTTSTSRPTASTTSTSRPTASTTSTSRRSTSTTSTRRPTTPARTAHTRTGVTTTPVRPTTANQSTTATLPTATGPAPHAAAGGAAIVPAQMTRERTSSGSAVPVVVGICLALVLAAGAAWAAWRRRRYE